MVLNIKTRLYLGFAAGIILVLLVAFISYITFERQYKEAGLVKHTYQVINQLQLTEKQLIDMETARRGFRSTNEREFLDSYYSGLEKIGPIENDLRDLIKDDGEQQQRAAALETEISNLLFFGKI